MLSKKFSFDLNEIERKIEINKEYHEHTRNIKELFFLYSFLNVRCTVASLEIKRANR